MINVSIVEDDAKLRATLARYLTGQPGFRCASTYPNAEVALADIPRVCPDVVLMDINLPGMTGIECVSRLKRLKPEIQIMMLTVYENSDRIFEALAAGANGFLIKNTPPDKLLEAIQEVSAGGGPMSGHIARKVMQAFQPVARDAAAKEHLTPREQEILELLSQGSAYKQIAGKLNLSMGTIQTHISRIYKKLHVNCRTHAVMKYLDGAGAGALAIPRRKS